MSRRCRYHHAKGLRVCLVLIGYREMGIAGVGWWKDTYGERSVVLLNPHEIAAVKAPVQ